MSLLPGKLTLRVGPYHTLQHLSDKSPPTRNEATMLLCISSAAMPRYKQDILRALAMPVGARLQFRYNLRWVAQALHDRTKSDSLKGLEACIAYIDQSLSEKPPDIAPIRAATILSTEVQGDFCVVEFELAGFAFAKDLPAFNKQLRTLSGNLPNWIDGSVKGHYLEEIDRKTLALEMNADTGQWQGICKALVAYPDFQAQKLFYRLERVYRVATGRPAECKDGVLRLCAGDLYDLQLLHYSPKKLAFQEPLKNDGLNWLVTDADEKVLTFVSTRALAIDSDYDVKAVRVRAATTTVPLDARVSFSRRPEGATKAEDGTWDFDLQARVTPRWWTLTWQGLVGGALVAAQGLLLTFNNKNIENQATVAILVGVVGLATGLFASFGLRKP